MPVVDEKEYQLLLQYQALLETVEEGFAFIERQDSQEAYRVLADIFSAFIQIRRTHRWLQQHFADDERVLAATEEFNDVMAEVEQLEGRFTKDNMVRHLIPMFQHWKLEQMKALSEYTMQ